MTLGVSFRTVLRLGERALEWKPAYATHGRRHWRVRLAIMHKTRHRIHAGTPDEFGAGSFKSHRRPS